MFIKKMWKKNVKVNRLKKYFLYDFKSFQKTNKKKLKRKTFRLIINYKNVDCLSIL